MSSFHYIYPQIIFFQHPNTQYGLYLGRSAYIYYNGWVIATDFRNNGEVQLYIDLSKAFDYVL